uniref:Putative secreted protein n=1 Tax=Ixodes ricinus TaxID=34613 RepID=A0A6B0UFV4_IXORI
MRRARASRVPTLPVFSLLLGTLTKGLLHSKAKNVPRRECISRGGEDEALVFVICQVTLRWGMVWYAQKPSNACRLGEAIYRRTVQIFGEILERKQMGHLNATS